MLAPVGENSLYRLLRANCCNLFVDSSKIVAIPYGWDPFRLLKIVKFTVHLVILINIRQLCFSCGFSKNDQLCIVENSDQLLIKYPSSTEEGLWPTEIVDYLSGKSVIVLDETKQQ
ncbi:hypothetical protein TNCV_4507711 [Trichonephila clavipes]|nr:hypothetical protein TNCV_4507711 [Trichonephila clavipes]